ncbi:MAG: tol-pal system YbgF family protein [Ignavibacteriaceae bacterium]
MKKIILLIIFFGSINFVQTAGQQKGINLFSPPNIKKFADYLFCTHDYLRAALEYQKYISISYNDTVSFKVAVAYSKIGNYSRAAELFQSFNQNSILFPNAQLELYKALFQDQDYVELRNDFIRADSSEQFKFYPQAEKLYYFSYLFTGGDLPIKTKFLNQFDGSDFQSVKNFYEWKEDSPYKNSLAAGILSAIIPGAGKFYVKEYSDGIFAFLATAGLGYLSYTDFKAGHNFRGWVFGGLAAGFYAGNIYGSVAAVQIYNVKIQYDFENTLKLFLNAKNYFTPEINFCR